MKVTVLGCGASWGVPKIGGDWGQCDPANPRNRRRRAGIAVEEAGTTILVDAAPDLREALLACDIGRIDAVIFTHAHADHLHGIDDLRIPSWTLGRPIPAFGDAKTIATIRHRFGYTVEGIRDPNASGYYYQPLLEPHEVAGNFTAAGVRVTVFEQAHGRTPSLGLRFGSFAYSTDVVGLDDAAFAALAGVEVWIVDCMRRTKLPTHSHLAQSLAWIERVGPKRAFLTHMDETMDYEALKRELPPPVEPAYDGMVIDV
ncbi:MAG TPA: MBL fold metallo-hydrolase [Stellaceae bacterium]|jgi:phosphoribosyl 1,2-cyclic phosphate phosphodiesterase|nr:MBL fold metallo-hydrolase [Stellaceae bacterium]